MAAYPHLNEDLIGNPIVLKPEAFNVAFQGVNKIVDAFLAVGSGQAAAFDASQMVRQLLLLLKIKIKKLRSPTFFLVDLDCQGLGRKYPAAHVWKLAFRGGCHQGRWV